MQPALFRTHRNICVVEPTNVIAWVLTPCDVACSELYSITTQKIYSSYINFVLKCMGYFGFIIYICVLIIVTFSLHETCRVTVYSCLSHFMLLETSSILNIKYLSNFLPMKRNSIL
jgi:hypothetical protein